MPKAASKSLASSAKPSKPLWVTRPLATPPANRGVDSHSANYDDLAMRASMQYDIQAQGTVVALDVLAGVAVLDWSVAAAVV